jgi:hypothetical protein
MHEQQLTATRRGQIDRRLAGIRRGSDPSYGSGGFDLETVQGAGIILDIIELQVPVPP